LVEEKKMKLIKINTKNQLLLLVLTILLMYSGCQNTIEPEDVTKDQSIVIRVLDQSDNFIIGARVFYQIETTTGLQPRRELSGSATGLFEGSFVSPLQASYEDFKIRIIVEPPRPPFSNDLIATVAEMMFS